jgi:hypothetical protein
VIFPRGRVARTLSEEMNWVAHTTGSRVWLLISWFPVFIRWTGAPDTERGTIWVAHASGLRVGLLIWLFPVFIR